MDKATREHWQELHRRFCLGESLSAEEQGEYDSGCRELDDEEMAEIEATGLQEELARFRDLEEENKRLEAEKHRLDAEIASLETALGDRARRRLRVGV